jgi:hypothetical protein
VIQLSRNSFLMPKPRTHLASSTANKFCLILALAFTLAITLQPIPAQGGLNATVDLSNPRIVPVYVSPTGQIRPGTVNADWSGFLYSSRIVFTAAHTEIRFDNEGNQVRLPRPAIVVGKPNSRAGESAGAVRVVKTIFSKTYRFNQHALDDFAIYILDKDLVEMPPAKLLTPEIEKELLAQNTPVKMHGYGEYGDRCRAGEAPPCNNLLITELPRSLTATLSTLSEIEQIVGYRTPNLVGELTIFNGKAGFGCTGDSGGSVTAVYKNDLTYLGPTPNGWRTYACGYSTWDTKGGINYTSPIYKHLDILKEAEDYVSEMRAKELKEAEQIKADRERAAAAAVAVKKPKVLVCKKGLVKKRITSAPFKCPKGFTKR